MKFNYQILKKSFTYFLRVILSVALIFYFISSCSDDDDPEINPISQNSPPQCINIADQTLNAGSISNINLCAVDPDGNSLSFNISKNPGFISIKNTIKKGDTTEVKLEIAPEENIVGTFNTTVKVSDGMGGVDSTKFKVNVLNNIPLIEDMPDINLTAGRTKEIQISASDIDGELLSFTIPNNPGFLSISNTVQEGKTTSAKLHIAPLDVQNHIGTFETTIEATDKKGDKASKIISITINTPVNIVNIYFCGTGMTEDWWDPNLAVAPSGLSGFWVPEVVSTLYRKQKTESDSIRNYYKSIVNGIGTGTTIPFADLFVQGFPSDPNNPRGWDKCLSEGKSYLSEVMGNSTGKIILNLVGFSRGAVLCMWMANDVSSYDKIEHINLLCYDPVPGDFDKEPISIYNINGKVKHYIGIYAEDERTNFFDPRIPYISSTNTKSWMFSLPGSHETMVGNSQVDGHSIAFYNPVINGKFNDDLLNVSWITKVISTELMYSNNWGNIKFDWSWNKDKNLFITNYNNMYTYGDYNYMRTVSFIPLNIAAYWGETCRWCTALDMIWPLYNYKNPRCAKKILSNNTLKWVGLQNEVYKLSGIEAWNMLKDITDENK